jgi:hypothetical protein
MLTIRQTSTKSVDTAVKWAGQVYGTSVITTPQSILTLDISNNTWKPSSLGAVKINIGLGGHRQYKWCK